MPIPYGSQIDLQQIPVLNLVPYKSGTAPSSPVTGQLWYDSTNNQLKVYLGAGPGWAQCDNVTGGTASNVADGDKGMITVSSGVWNIDASVITSTMIVDGTIAVGDLAFTPVKSGDAAGGDLAGTYPNPTIGTGKVTTTQILDGTIAIGDISTSSVRLDTVGAPTAGVALNNQKITGMADPTANTDAATKQYVDAAAQGLDVKPSVRAIATANITLSGTQTIDGVSVVAGDRVLCVGQTTGANNGIYVVAAGAWSRSTDADTSAEVNSGMFTFVEEGTTNKDSGWVLTTDNPITLNTTSLAFTQFSGAGQITAGNGLTKTGNTIDLVAGDTSLTVAADAVSVNTAVIAPTARTLTAGTGITGGGDLSANRTFALDTTYTDGRYAPISVVGTTKKYNATLGAMTAGAETTITHSLGTTEVVAAFRDATTNYAIEFAWRVISTTQIGLTPDVSYGASAVKVVVVG